MTNKAISLLHRQNKKGFFLQVEGASIDKRDHAADACGQIGETVDLDEAVQAALRFAKRDGNTLVLLTADGAPMTLSYGTAPAGARRSTPAPRCGWPGTARGRRTWWA